MLRLALCALLVGPGLLVPQDAGDVERGRERWESMSEQERALVEERYRRFRELDEPEREALLESHTRLVERRDSLRTRLEDELRELPRPQQPHVLFDELRSEIRDRGRDLRPLLPTELAEQLEGAPPWERHRLLHDWRRSQHRRGLSEVLGGLSERLELGPDAMRAFDALRGSERRAALHRTLRESAITWFAEAGLPEGLSAVRWEEMLRLPDDAFLEELREFTGVGPPHLVQGPTHGAGRPPGPPAGSWPRWEIGSRAERRRAVRELFDLMDELREGRSVRAPGEAARVLRERAEAFVTRFELLSGAELERMRGADDATLLSILRPLLDQEHRGLGFGPGGPSPLGPGAGPGFGPGPGAPRGMGRGPRGGGRRPR